ncbi:MAG: DUF2202 domain-containing protein [Campylobacterota bacterium]|nr:DUF2202 domain-containing protein [Campylobacterota bacterium]
MKNLIFLTISFFFIACSDDNNEVTASNNDEVIYDNVTKPNVYSYPYSSLDTDMKYSLAYMWNEEKLAKDIYLSLNELYSSNTLKNIATRSEVVHEEAVEELVEKYDLNITNLIDYEENYSEEELNNLAQGVFAIPEIQTLYDELYSYGKVSLQSSLEVGCMVEVTDIIDLDKYIVQAQDNNASDLVDTFKFLRDGSYRHYWAFDKALKNIGVGDGCCYLGVINGVDYCQEDYPYKN